jgi:hypothetical protein
MQRWVWFSDAPIFMVFEDAELYNLTRPMLDELRQDPGPIVRFTCIFKTSSDLHNPFKAALAHEGSLGAAFGVPGKIFVAEDKEWLLVEDVGSVEIDSGTRTACIRILPGANRRLTSMMAIYAFDAILSATGQQLLHGAGLMLPSGEGAMLLFAPSGAGKTTTSMALALDGFRMLTDDALVLRRERAATTVWGFPRAMKVHWRTVELLPALKGLFGEVWNAEGEQVLTRRAFSEIGSIASGPSSPIATVLLLGERSNGGHFIDEASKADVLLALARDNIAISRLGVLQRQVRKMETVAELVNGVPVGRLHVGKSLDTLGSVVIEYCERKCRQPARLAASA